jgi:prepilin-type N-terminal cleavage/methylation domain-containing protein
MNKIKKAGFTLIELLLVISIIGLLSSIVFANLRDAREKAQIVSFQEGIRQVLLAIEVYKNDNGGYLSPDIQETDLIPKYLSKKPRTSFR